MIHYTSLFREYSFNLSQFANPRQLTSALIQTRDTALEGVVPIVFFDEFDSSLDHEPLGWLKYFLSPMHDGKFHSEEAGMLRTGRAIFVFAGGTSKSYREFTRVDRDSNIQDEFRNAKGPDFVSRLRGFVDIIGPDPRPDTDDEVYIIRRAIAIRSLIEQKFPQLIEDHKPPLDNDVAHALLTVSRYEHGTRSIEAILEMSALAHANRFEKFAVPSKEQLDMHIARSSPRPYEFFRLMERMEWSGTRS